MDDVLRNLIRKNLSLKETEDLIQIWQRKNVEEYEEEVFEIISEILSERPGFLPPQSDGPKSIQSINHIESLLETMKLEEVIRECDSLLQIEPTLAKVYHYRGLAYDEMGEFEKAIIDYRKAFQLNPELKDAWEDFKSVEKDIENEFLQSALKQHLDKALEFAIEDEYENAMNEIKLAIPLLPSIANSYNYLGMIFEGMDKLEEAIAAYRIAIQLNPKYYAARENLGNASYKLEEDQYRKISTLDINSYPEYDETLLVNSFDEEKPVPGWVYLDYPSYILQGWPGHRNRPGRSGYDPLKMEFEHAHMLGRITRMMFTGKLKTDNFFYLVVMSIFGISLCAPLFYRDQNMLGMLGVLLMFIPYWVFGLAILANVFLSIRMKLVKRNNGEREIF